MPTTARLDQPDMRSPELNLGWQAILAASRVHISRKLGTEADAGIPRAAELLCQMPASAYDFFFKSTHPALANLSIPQCVVAGRGAARGQCEGSHTCSSAFHCATPVLSLSELPQVNRRDPPFRLDFTLKDSCSENSILSFEMSSWIIGKAKHSTLKQDFFS